MPEIWISTTTGELSLGQSRIGGVPDLPRGTIWPRHRWTRDETKAWPDFAQQELTEAIANGVVLEELHHVALALPFVAQLDLAELARFDTPLPKTGHLWLFADQQTTLGEIGFAVYQASACLYAEHAVLERVDPPPTPETLTALALTFSIGEGEQPEPRHTVMPVSDQGVHNDVPPAGYRGLLRVDSDYALDPIINWGDAAWMTFAMPPDALAARRWDEVRAFRFCG
jgi:hypothetical protein